MTIANKLGLCVVVLALTACASASKQYVEPEDPEIKQCIDSCQVVRTQCRAGAQDRYKMCRNNYEFLEREYSHCVRTGNMACQKPPRCPPPETRGCTMQYDDCYQVCGGEILKGSEIERSSNDG